MERLIFFLESRKVKKIWKINFEIFKLIFKYYNINIKLYFDYF